MSRARTITFGPITGTGAPNRDDLDLGTYEPDAATTGVLPGTVLTPLVGNQTITTAGLNLVDRDIFGVVDVRAANVTIRNCRIRDDVNWVTNHGSVMATNSACVNLSVIDCTIRPDVSTVWQTGILGHDYTAFRCDVYYTIDGFGVYKTQAPGAATNVTIDQNYVHDLCWFQTDPNHTDGSHNDTVQIQGGSGCRVRGNSLRSYFTNTANGGTGIPNGHPQALSCVMLNANVGATTACEIEDNWCYGGEIGINGGGVTGNIGRIWRNKFSYDQWYQGAGGTNTHTIDLDGLVTCDTGGVGANRNLYIDGQDITVRTNA